MFDNFVDWTCHNSQNMFFLSQWLYNITICAYQVVHILLMLLAVVYGVYSLGVFMFGNMKAQVVVPVAQPVSPAQVVVTHQLSAAKIESTEEKK